MYIIIGDVRQFDLKFALKGNSPASYGLFFLFITVLFIADLLLILCYKKLLTLNLLHLDFNKMFDEILGLYENLQICKI